METLISLIPQELLAIISSYCIPPPLSKLDHIILTDGDPPEHVKCPQVRSICADSHGNIFLADKELCVILKFNAQNSPKLSRFCGHGGKGNTDGPPDKATLDPYTLMMDNQGNLLVLSDPDIRTVSPDGTVSTITTTPRLPCCFGFAVGKEDIFFTDFDDDRLLRLKPDSTFEQFKTIPSDEQFLGYCSCWFDLKKDNLFVLDKRSGRIRKVSVADGQITQVAKDPEGQHQPYDLCMDGYGNFFYVMSDGTIKMLKPDGTYLSTNRREILAHALTIDREGNLWFVGSLDWKKGRVLCMIPAEPSPWKEALKVLLSNRI